MFVRKPSGDAFGGFRISSQRLLFVIQKTTPNQNGALVSKQEPHKPIKNSFFARSLARALSFRLAMSSTIQPNV